MSLQIRRVPQFETSLASLLRGPVRTALRPYWTVARARKAKSTLKHTLAAQIPVKRKLLQELRSEHGNESLGQVTVESTMGGMRGLKAMLWESSVLDPDEGIRFQGMTISECLKKFPKGDTGKEILPEGIFWLLLTGKIPTDEQVKRLSAELVQRVLDAERKPDLRGMENVGVHPMVRLSTGVLALSEGSKFAKAYIGGMNKEDLWDPSMHLCSTS
jgi:citrate synthase